MTERSRFWDGILGDGGPYNQSHLHDQFFRSLLNGTGNRGVLRNWLDELEVTGTSSPLTVATGGAIVYGGIYENTEPVSISVSTPSVTDTTRTDLIVVRKSWATQLIRIARVEGTPTVPATITQTPLVQYEIPLAQIVVDSSGAITVTDTREWCTYSTQWAANTVDTEQFAEGAVTAAKIPDRTRYFIKGSGQLHPDSGAAPVWTVGANYDFWNFADAATQTLWMYEHTPYDLTGATLDIYLWTVPVVNGAGGAPGTEDVRWEYNYDITAGGEITAFTTGTILAGQEARVNTTVYRDLLVSIAAVNEQNMIQLYFSRTGAHGGDTYASAMQLLGIEVAYTAQA